MKHASILVLLLISASVFRWGLPQGTPSGDCDQLAADPYDHGRVKPGVETEKIVPEPAVAACRTAMEQAPSEPRYRRQLARALDAAGRPSEATEQLAPLPNDAFARFYLAKQRLPEYWQAANHGEDEKARALLAAMRDQLQGAESYEPAANLLNQITLDQGDFRLPRLIGILLDGDMPRANRARLFVAAYAKGVQRSFEIEFHPDGQECPAYVANPVYMRAIDRALVGDPGGAFGRIAFEGGKRVASLGGILVDPVWSGDLEKWFAWFERIGLHDGLMVTKLKTCTSPATREFYEAAVIQVAKNPLPISLYLKDFVTGESVRDLFPELVAEIFGSEDTATSGPASPTDN